MMCNSQTVLMLGGSQLQVPAIKAAQQAGFKVICADRNPESVGFEIADGFSLTSTLDVEAIIKLAKSLSVDYVITSTSDAPVRIAAYVSEELGLPTGISYENARCATYKDEMRTRLSTYSIPMPEYRACNSAREFEQALKYFDYHCIAKPADSSASRGVKLIDGLSRTVDKTNLFEHFKSFSRKGTVMVEELITGPEVSVEAITMNGETDILAITDKLVTDPPFFVELGHSEQSQLDKSIQERIRRVAIDTIRAIGIENGPSHTEIKISEEGPRVIEIAARLGGDLITSKLVPLSTGVNFVAESTRLALGLDASFSPKWNQGAAILFLTAMEPGIIKHVQIDSDIELIPGLIEYMLYKREGDSIDTPHSSNDRIGHVICSGETAQDAITATEQVIARIGIQYE